MKTNQAESPQVAAHTPGPWFNDGDETELIATKSGEVIAELSGENAEANARLIAAAPELLAFADSFLLWAEQMRSVNRSLPGMEAREGEARAAIAKAKGGQ